MRARIRHQEKEKQEGTMQDEKQRWRERHSCECRGRRTERWRQMGRGGGKLRDEAVTGGG